MVGGAAILTLILNVAPIVALGDQEPGGESVAPREEETRATALAATTPSEEGHRKMRVLLTAYSSTPDQTDETPFITASNTGVRDGVVATNILPLGTRLMIPALFGAKIFVVEDRMNERYNGQYVVDIWQPDRASAEIFGVKEAVIIIL